MAQGYSADRRVRDRNSRIARLRAELTDEGVPLPTHGKASTLFLGELAYARRPRVHERYVPRYGSMLWESADGFETLTDQRSVTLVPLPQAELNHLRRFADGRASFLVQRVNGERLLACFHHPLEYESDLVRLQRSTGAYIIQRTGEGIVRVFTEDTLVTWDGVRWISKPPARRFQSPIEQLVPQANADVLGGILEFCAHWLSPAYVGSTLVWYMCDPADLDSPLIDLSVAKNTPPLRLTDRAQYPALLSVLQQLDGAVIIAPDGTVRRLQGLLRPTERARRLVPALRGTRHTSARRFSFDEPRSLVFVVSEDGPVSVFSDGARTALVRTDQSWTRPPGSIEQRVAGHTTRDVTCATCAKQLIVELFAGDDAQPDCPVCGDIILPDETGGVVVGIRKA